MIARASFLGALMLTVAFAVAFVGRPSGPAPISPDLAAMLPAEIEGWTPVDINTVVLPQEVELGPGEAVTYRAYRDAAGRTVTLVAAYGPPLGDSVRLHRPETCYVAQGYVVRSRWVEALEFTKTTAPVVRMETEKSLYKEAVSYWLRDGNLYVTNAPQRQLQFFRPGGREKNDGALIRISSRGEGSHAFDIHDQFMKDFVAALSPEAQKLFMVDAS